MTQEKKHSGTGQDCPKEYKSCDGYRIPKEWHIVRFDSLFSFIRNTQLRRFVITAILLGIAAVGAALGFQAMLQQGTSIVGWAAIPVIVIPAFTIVAAKVRRAK